MSYFQDAVIACPNTQAWLNDMWRRGMTPGVDEQMPVAEFLTSAINRREVGTAIAPGGGKVRTVQLKYRPRLVESNKKTNQANPNCSPTGFYGELDEPYTIDVSVNIQHQSLIPVDSYDDSCTDNGFYFQKEVMDLVDVMDRSVATQITNQAAVLSGTWNKTLSAGFGTGQVNASNELVLKTFNTSTDAPNLRTWSLLRNAADDSGMGGAMLISGGGEWREYFQASRAGCCSTTGIDLGTMFGEYGYAFAHDYRLERALGSKNKGMLFMPGALQVVNWTRAGWLDGAPAPITGAAASNYLHTAVASPRLAQRYDLTITNDCGNIGIALTYTGKVIGLPNDVFATGDVYEGTTGVTKIIAVN